MLFLELAAQSVRGFSPSVRVAIKPGYVALQSPVELPAPLSGVIVALAFPDGRGGDGAFLAPGAKAGRAGLSIQGNDGSVWRIVRDLGGAGGLHKLNRATNTFDIVTQDASEMGQTLRSSVGFPARTTWEQLFTLNGQQLPTRRPKGPARAPAAAAGKAAPRMMSKWGDLDGGPAPEVDPSKLPALEAELATAKRAAEVQFRADGLASEVYELEAKVRVADQVTEELNAARAELTRAASRELPDDIIARARRLPDDKKKFDEQVAKLQDEQRALVETAPQPPAPLQKDQQFLASAVVGVGLFVAAMFLDGGLRYLALLSLVPFTFAALLALRFIEDLQRLSRGGGKGEVLASREKKLTDDFQLHSMAVTKAFEQVGVSSLEEFLTAMEVRGSLKARVAEIEQREVAARAALETSGVKGRYDALKAEQETLNQELLGMSGGFVRDVRDIEREIARIKEPAPAPKAAAPAEFTAVSTAAGETWDDPVPPLLMLATDLFSADVPSLWSVLHDRAVQYIGALTDRRYHEISVDKDGHATLEAPGRSVSARELPGRDLDLVYLALRLTLIEKAAAQHKLPVVIEDTFNTVLDAAKQPLFGRMVKHLGSLTQVIHVSGAGQNASLADVAVTI